MHNATHVPYPNEVVGKSNSILLNVPRFGGIEMHQTGNRPEVSRSGVNGNLYWLYLSNPFHTRMELVRLATEDDNMLEPKREQLCVGMMRSIARWKISK